MSDIPPIHYTWIYQCLRCKMYVARHQPSRNFCQESDPNTPKGPCSCVSLEGKWRPFRGDGLSEEDDDHPEWYCLCDCGNQWTEPRVPGQAQLPDKGCSTCFPRGMWQLKAFECSANPRVAIASKFQEDLPTFEGAVPSEIPTEANLGCSSSQQHECNASKKSRIFQRLSKFKRKHSTSDQKQDDDRNSITKTTRRPSLSHSLMDVDIPSPGLGTLFPRRSSAAQSLTGDETSSHEVEILNPRFRSEDEDEDMEQARGFPSDQEEDSDEDDNEVPASLLIETAEDDDDDEQPLVQSNQLTFGDPGRSGNTDRMDIRVNDNSLGIFSYASANYREIHLWSPEEGRIRLEVDVQTVNPADLRLRDTPFESSEVVRSSSILQNRRPDNAARIQQVRDFFSIPESVPTSSIPSFIKDHQRVGWALQHGIVLTGGGLSFRNRYPHIWLLSTRQERLAEINEVLNSDTIVWEDDVGREVGETDIVAYDARAADFQGTVTVDSRINFIRLDGEDASQFWSAVGISEDKSSRLVAEEQQPRLPIDLGSPSGVWEASDLILEVKVQVKECEPEPEDEGDDLEE
ncbi:hypothetical protein IFR04_015840 [Cadophora malorum]|uniref:Uncharacterized protein n=1 Tax=Cadophora malorum TaxID=108018 RepID=A0A8H7T0K2_9HELO|nr:hypothetical protein IFR04_015840 [Cadophora malorum]